MASCQAMSEEVFNVMAIAIPEIPKGFLEKNHSNGCTSQAPSLSVYP